MGENSNITNEQLFEFMTKMYSEMQGMKENIATKDDLDKTNQSIARLEHKMDTNHKALYDGYKLTYEKLTTLEKKVDEIDNKVERQDVEIRVIKGVK
ncbi:MULTISPECIES: hypothetical protein [Bacillota]|uniref:hypothetical protein n=1 Tax=Bacillota TaxID=1239 RepID=UPI001F273B9D|nr:MULTISPECIES: hypothetical protein [Bacillota]HSH36898.1 hypothetical protein [Schnuerera sp.]